MYVFPDVEALLVAWLKPRVGVPVSVRVPSDRPASFVRVTRVGGPKKTVVSDHPMVSVQCWAASGAAAAALGAKVRALVDAVVEMPGVYGVLETGGLMNYPDPDSKSDRYQFTVQLHIRGTKAPAP